jgi:hypothetical protein
VRIKTAVEMIPVTQYHQQMQLEWLKASTLHLASTLAKSPAFSPHVALRPKPSSNPQLGVEGAKRCTFDFGSANDHDLLKVLFQQVPSDVRGYQFQVSYPQKRHLPGKFVFPGTCFQAREAKSVFLCSFTFTANEEKVYTLMIRWAEKAAEDHVFDVAVHTALQAFVREHQAMGETIPAHTLTALLQQLGRSALAAIASKRPPVATVPEPLQEWDSAKLIETSYGRVPKNLVIDRGPPLAEADEDSEAGSSVRTHPRRPALPPPKKKKRSRTNTHPHESPVASRTAKKSATGAKGQTARGSLQAVTSVPALPQAAAAPAPSTAGPAALLPDSRELDKCIQCIRQYATLRMRNMGNLLE